MEFTLPNPKNLFQRKPTYTEWIEESVEFFRQLGFFESQSRMTTANLVAKLEKLQEETYAKSFEPFEKVSDFDIIAWDQKRVWFVDADALILPGNEAYVQALQELSAISRKQFPIRFVEEIWEDEEGPIKIRFVYKRKEYEFCPEYLETYFDHGILAFLNTFLEHTKFKFELCGDILENPIVLMLHEEEKELLCVKRGWKFVDLVKD
jgi:hypothetical protein